MPSCTWSRGKKCTPRVDGDILLWEMLHGDVISDGWRDEHVKEVLDLCLACKGCKGDCPVNVDMATVTRPNSWRTTGQGRVVPVHAYALRLIYKWARLATIAPGFANLFTQLPGVRDLAKLAVGVPKQRQIPAFAPRAFSPGSVNAKQDQPKVPESSLGRYVQRLFACPKRRRLRSKYWNTPGCQRRHFLISTSVAEDRSTTMASRHGEIVPESQPRCTSARSPRHCYWSSWSRVAVRCFATNRATLPESSAAAACRKYIHARN